MKSKLYIAAGILWMVWLIGFFFLNAGPMVHVLAGLAILFYLEALIITPKPKQEQNV
ncbi:MAG TPA: hypothetical protein VLJ68_12660 [Chitinophagaceae bacterium]|nr:hypothetical protein [Chitinophagaceae bacterium]